AAALNQTPLDWGGNRERIERAIDIARNAGASMLCLPELCISGYGCEDAFQSPSVERTAREMLADIAPTTEDIIVSVGLPLRHQSALYNSTALCVDGRIAGAVAKQNLAGDGVHYEPRWFKPWPEDHCTELELAGRRVPFGDVYFECGDIKVGFEICEDAWVADRPGGRLMRRGVDVIFNPSASHFAFDKQQIRERFVIEGSRAFGVSYLYANLLGNEAGRIIYDGGTLIASDGELKASGPRFSYADVEVLYGQIDVDKTRMNRAKLASFEPDPAEAERATVAVDFDYPDPPPVDNELTEPDWMVGADQKFEEFTRAVTLGLFDYLRKSGAQGFVVSLSGGADSSTTGPRAVFTRMASSSIVAMA
ncbi:MAG: nitrilase-related carbon-nitrogen hydrolase, partial [Bradymonadaceae bacterium]